MRYVKIIYPNGPPRTVPISLGDDELPSDTQEITSAITLTYSIDMSLDEFEKTLQAKDLSKLDNRMLEWFLLNDGNDITHEITLTDTKVSVHTLGDPVLPLTDKIYRTKVINGKITDDLSIINTYLESRRIRELKGFYHIVDLIPVLGKNGLDGISIKDKDVTIRPYILKMA